MLLQRFAAAVAAGTSAPAATAAKAAGGLRTFLLVETMIIRWTAWSCPTPHSPPPRKTFMAAQQHIVSFYFSLLLAYTAAWLQICTGTSFLNKALALGIGCSSTRLLLWAHAALLAMCVNIRFCWRLQSSRVAGIRSHCPYTQKKMQRGTVYIRATPVKTSAIIKSQQAWQSTGNEHLQGILKVTIIHEQVARWHCMTNSIERNNGGSFA